MSLRYLPETANRTAVAASVTASSEASGYPVANLKATPVAKPWRAQGCSAEYVLVDHGSAKSVSAVALVGHNLTSAATVTFSAGSTPSCADYSTVIPYAAGTMAKFITAISYRYNKIAIANPANPHGFVQVGLLILGVETVLETAPLASAGVTRRYVNLERTTDGGAPLVRRLHSRAEWTLAFDGLDAAEAAQIDAMAAALARNAYGMLFTPDPASPATVAFGRLAGDIAWTVAYYRSCSLAFVEDGAGFIVS